MSYNSEFRRRYEAEQAALVSQELQAAPKETDRAHLFTSSAGILIPFGQAVLTGALFGGAATFYAWLLKSPEFWEWGAGTGLTVAVFTWLLLLFRWSDLTRPLFERIVNRDIDGDGIIGKPRPTIRVEISDKTDNSIKFIDLPGDMNSLRTLATGLLSGRSFSEGEWTGSGKPFSRPDFRILRAELLARGLLLQSNDKDVRQGYCLTPSGRAVMRHFLSESPALPRE